MTSEAIDRRKDRARAFVPELIPEPQDLDRTGPLDIREQRDLDRIHAARDNHQNAQWMRGKALEAAFRRRLYRGDDGTRTRQEYLNDEWDGISESAAYLEINEWRLAAEISEVSERPAPDSHVRALVDVAEKVGQGETARRYRELCLYANEHKLRVTAKVVGKLATYLSTGEMPSRELDTLFVRQLPPPPRKAPEGPSDGVDSGTAGDGSAKGSFQNFGMDAPGSSEPPADDQPAGSAAGDADRWSMSAEQARHLTSWLVCEADVIGVGPDRVAGLLLQVLDGQPQLSTPIRTWMRSQVEG